MERQEQEDASPSVKPCGGDEDKVGVLREIDYSVDKVTRCKLCFRSAQPDAASSSSPALQLGPLYEYEVDREVEVYCAHYFCLLFSSGLDQNGEDDEGIKGFLTSDVLKEWKRGQRLKCTVCQGKYATVGCANKACRKTFHLPCAFESGALAQFCGNFAVYCREHRPSQDHPPIIKSSSNQQVTCGICLDGVELEENEVRLGGFLWAPCCSGWFHRQCVNSLARSTGYFFKCPLCNDKIRFESEMKTFGIHVPERDASWEVQQEDAAGGGYEGFGALLERHDTCDAETCRCPNGRKIDVDDTMWEIILCWSCGSRGIHLKCASLPLEPDTRWSCDSCDDVQAKLPPSYSNHYCRMKQTRRTDDATVIPVFRLDKDNTLVVQHKGVEFKSVPNSR